MIVSSWSSTAFELGDDSGERKNITKKKKKKSQYILREKKAHRQTITTIKINKIMNNN